MTRLLKLAGGLVALFIVMVAGLYAYRVLMLRNGRTPEGYALLTAMPGTTGFEPATLPAGPILKNRSADTLSVDFGYEVGRTPYSYTLALSFPPKADQGHATLTVRHATRSATVQSAATRFWDGPRKAFAVALQDHFDLEPPVPSLCIKAVIGPSQASYDLDEGSICIAQRDTAGTCHPETLACGLIR